jgi:dephospho-CoA kinase
VKRDRPRSYCVALTGGIASGKSATAACFTRLGVPVFDADVVAHAVVARGQPALQEVAAAFGEDMITAQGDLDRARLRALVFDDATARARLEGLLHPRIRNTLVEDVRACAATYCVLAIPLLVESWGDYRWVDRVLMTDVPPELQLARLSRRPGIDAALAAHILAAQASRAQRLALAHDIIDNTAPLESLVAVSTRLHRIYLELATATQGAEAH